MDNDIADLLNKSDAFTEESEEALGEDFLEDDEVKRQFEHLKLQKAKQLLKEQAIAKAMPAVPPPGQCAGSSSRARDSQAGEPVQGRRIRVFRPVEATGPTVEEARKMLPPGFSLSKDTSRENRWRMRAKGVDKDRSKSFGRGSGLDEYQSLVVLLEWAWRRHFELAGESCPFAFESVAQ